MPAIPDDSTEVYGSDETTRRIFLFAVFMVLFHLVALVSFKVFVPPFVLLLCIYYMCLTEIQAYWLLKMHRNDSSEVRHQGKIRIS